MWSIVRLCFLHFGANIFCLFRSANMLWTSEIRFLQKSIILPLEKRVKDHQRIKGRLTLYVRTVKIHRKVKFSIKRASGCYKIMAKRIWWASFLPHTVKKCSFSALLLLFIQTSHQVHVSRWRRSALCRAYYEEVLLFPFCSLHSLSPFFAHSFQSPLLIWAGNMGEFRKFPERSLVVKLDLVIYKPIRLGAYLRFGLLFLLSTVKQSAWRRETCRPVQQRSTLHFSDFYCRSPLLTIISQWHCNEQSYVTSLSEPGIQPFGTLTSQVTWRAVNMADFVSSVRRPCRYHTELYSPWNVAKVTTTC